VEWKKSAKIGRNEWFEMTYNTGGII